MWTFSKGLCILRSVTHIIAAVTGTCIFGDAATFKKDCRVLFGDIFIVPFLGSALGLTAMCSLGWGNFDWNDLPVGRELDCKFLFGVVEDTTTTKFTGRACAVHCN